MKAVAVFPQRQTLQLIDHPEPAITHPSQAKIRMLEVGICGTDREICRFEYGVPPPDEEYLILGHEGLGQVVAVGTAVEHVRVGDLVAIMVRRPCPHAHCRACRTGRPDFCQTQDFTERGIKGLHGMLADYVVEDEHYLQLVPHDLRAVGVLIEPTTIACKALTQAAFIQRRLPWFDPHRPADQLEHGYTGLVLGAGAVGLLGALALRSVGFETYVYDRAPAPNAKSDLVESIGAHYAFPADHSPEFAHLVEEINVVYEATGASALAFRAIQALGPNGIFIFTGVPGAHGRNLVETDQIMQHAVLLNQVILGTVNAGREDFLRATHAVGTFARRWPVAMQALLAHRSPLAAYRDVLLTRPPGIKQVLTVA